MLQKKLHHRGSKLHLWLINMKNKLNLSQVIFTALVGCRNVNLEVVYFVKEKADGTSAKG